MKAKGKLIQLLTEETTGLHPKLLWLRFLSRTLPDATPATIADWLRSVGVGVGPGTKIEKLPYLTGSRGFLENLTLGAECFLEPDVVFDLQDKIKIGDRVRLSRAAMLLTSTHQIGSQEHRAGALQLAPVTIGSDAQIGHGALICPGVRIGAGSTVDANAMVNKDVPDGAFVSGNPATIQSRSV